MNKHALNAVVAVLLLAAGVAQAQPSVYLATDPFHLACEAYLVDDAPGTKSVYVIVGAGSLMQTRFAIEESADITMTYIGEVHPLPGTSGDVHSGLTICLTTCAYEPPTTLVRIDYMSYGTSPTCGEIRIVPAPGYDGIDWLDCFGLNTGVNASPLYVNLEYPNCVCFYPVSYLPSSIGISCEPVPVQESTWGSIKALYE